MPRRKDPAAGMVRYEGHGSVWVRTGSQKWHEEWSDAPRPDVPDIKDWKPLVGGAVDVVALEDMIRYAVKRDRRSR